jgi:hypothetical protein
VLLALICAAATASSIPVFSDPRLAEALGRFDARPGAWVEYAVLPKGGPQLRLRISVLGPALPDGRYWLEAVTQAQGTPPLAMKMLLHGAPLRADNIERLYLYAGGLAPLALPVADAHAAAPSPGSPPPKVERKGTQELKLGAGAFRCEVLQVKDTRIFRSDKVPLWGLVRAQDPEQRVELLGFAESGAETVFPPGYGNGNDSTK